MSDVLSRKAFFGKIFHQLADLSCYLIEAIGTTNRHPEPPIDPLWSDFSPAMLENEARRLGLEVEAMDREAILHAIQRRMQEQSRNR